MSVLRAEGLNVTARIGPLTVPALRDLNLALAPGKVLGLVGPDWPQGVGFDDNA